MSFYKGELRAFDLCEMYEDANQKQFLVFCNEGKSYEIEVNKEDNILNILRDKKELYYFFGKREGQYLSCVNGKKYMIDDERSKQSEGIFMGDAYFNKYDDINLGFLLSYEDGIIDIKPAIEGEGIECRRYEVVENCGDLYDEMQNFINKFII